MFGVGGTPFALIKKYIEKNGLNFGPGILNAGLQFGSKSANFHEAPPNTVLPFFSWPAAVDNAGTAVFVKLCAFNFDANAGYAGIMQWCNCYYASFGGGFQAPAFLSYGVTNFSINPALIAINFAISLTFAGGIATLKLTGTNSGSTGVTNIRIYAEIELLGNDGNNPITRL